MDVNQQKKLAAEKAVEEISSGMIVGLGTGSTVQFALEKISEKIKNGELKNLLCIPSSNNTENEARRLGIPLTTLNDNPLIDVTIDGADEFDEHLNLIKGGGGALLKEKILAQASKRLIIITDESKRSKYLGEKWPVPIEVVQMSVTVEKNILENLGAKTKIRQATNGQPYITDEGNFIIDANFGKIKNVKELAALLNQRAGIVEHGLFIGLASKILCALSNGSIEEFSFEKNRRLLS